MNKKAFLLVIVCLMLFITACQDKAKDTERKITVVPKSSVSGKKIALVIGNSDYKSGPLKNPINDAKLMAHTLRGLGFEVHEMTNLSYKDMNSGIDEFGDSIQRGAIALFYYAGHGVQSAGSNYLIPIDADIKSEPEIKYKTINAGYVLAKMENSKNPVNIVILDACRDNPFARSFRSSSRGLAKMDAPTGTFIAYATKDGMTASDGSGKNGLYTEELVKQMTVPNQKIEDVFKKVRTEVKNKSNGTQIPTEYTMLENDFYFAGGSREESSQTAETHTSVTQSVSTQSGEESKKLQVERERLRKEREEFEQAKALTKEKKRLEEERQKLEKEKQKIAMAPRPKAEKNGKGQTGERFSLKGGVINDSQLGLQWAPDNGQPMNHYEAEKYARNLSLAGGGWRLPTRAELKSLYDTSKPGNADPIFKLDRDWVWTSELEGSSSAWYFNFGSGVEDNKYRGNSSTYARVLAVRSRRLWLEETRPH
jgi:uncharacterized caspase-like protein